jgi:hypothetical protein
VRRSVASTLSGRISLRATSRPSSSSRARKTRPRPPSRWKRRMRNRDPARRGAGTSFAAAPAPPARDVVAARLAWRSASPSRSSSPRTGPGVLTAARLASVSPPCRRRCSATSACSSARRGSSTAPRSTKMRSRARDFSATQTVKAVSSSSRPTKPFWRASRPKSRSRPASRGATGPGDDPKAARTAPACAGKRRRYSSTEGRWASRRRSSHSRATSSPSSAGRSSASARAR